MTPGKSIVAQWAAIRGLTHTSLCRAIEMETLNLGLTPEEESATNSSRADPDSRHQRCRSDESSSTHPNKKPRKEPTVVEGAVASEDAAGDKEDDEEDTKSVRSEEKDDGGPEMVTSLVDGKEIIGDPELYLRNLNKRIMNRPKSSVNGVYESFVARPLFTMKGHTAFLTFAVRPVDAPSKPSTASL